MRPAHLLRGLVEASFGAKKVRKGPWFKIWGGLPRKGWSGSGKTFCRQEKDFLLFVQPVPKVFTTKVRPRCKKEKRSDNKRKAKWPEIKSEKEKTSPLSVYCEGAGKHKVDVSVRTRPALPYQVKVRVDDFLKISSWCVWISGVEYWNKVSPQRSSNGAYVFVTSSWRF